MDKIHPDNWRRYILHSCSPLPGMTVEQLYQAFVKRYETEKEAMIPVRFTHIVQDEVTNNVYFKGTFETCRTWIVEQDDWEQYGIVSRTTGRFVAFTHTRQS